MEPKIHTLNSGATVLVTSPGHGFKFSDGTVAEPQHEEVCYRLTLERKSRQVYEIKGMKACETKMVLNQEQRLYLTELCRKADIVLIPFPVLTALRESGMREVYPNALAMNATVETQRSAPTDKIVDLNNWSY